MGVRSRCQSEAVLPGADSATRAITIAATPEDAWPRLVQIGYGKAGWYSYDWVTNAGVVPHEFRLSNRDRIKDHIVSGHGGHMDDGMDDGD